MESGFVGVFEDINSMPKKSINFKKIFFSMNLFETDSIFKDQIPEFVYHTAGVLINLIDIIYAPISPLLTTVTFVIHN